MPSRKKINLQKVLASWYMVCTQCQAKIELSQIQRVRWDEVRCPFCDGIFVPSRRKESESDLPSLTVAA